jgi:ABC-type transport system involved in multi-copper enzyme maturation permease subunit
VGPGLSRIVTVAANTFRETVRERVLYNLVFFAVLMTVSGLLMGELSVRQDEKIVKDLGLAAMDVFGTLIAIFIGVGLVAKEIERRSLHPLLAKPLSRREFLLGRYFGLAFTLLVNLGIMLAGTYVTLFATARRFDPGLLAAAYTLYLGLLLVVAYALLFSSFTSTVLSAVGTFCVVVAGRFADVIRGMPEVLPGAPAALVKTLYFLVPNLHSLDLKNRVVYGEVPTPGDLGLLTLYALAYGGVVLGAALVAFERRDFQ